jgi:hypothetical protein
MEHSLEDARQAMRKDALNLVEACLKDSLEFQTEAEFVAELERYAHLGGFEVVASEHFHIFLEKHRHDSRLFDENYKTASEEKREMIEEEAAARAHESGVGDAVGATLLLVSLIGALLFSVLLTVGVLAGLIHVSLTFLGLPLTLAILVIGVLLVRRARSKGKDTLFPLDTEKATPAACRR